MRQKNHHDVLQQYLKDYWEFILKHNPTFATYIGDHRYDHALEDLSEQSISAQVRYFQNLQERLKNLDESSLTRENALHRKLLQKSLSDHIERHQYKTHYMPLDHLRGPHIDFPQIIEFHPFKTQKDIENYLARLHAFPRLIDQVIVLLQKGVQENMTVFTRTMEHVLKQFETFAQFKPENHPLSSPALKLSKEFSAQAQEKIKKSIKEAVLSSIMPAYKKLFEYLRDEYQKNCRQGEGIWSLPNGKNMYRFFVQYHTTTELSPGEIHAIGRSEVERIGIEIEKVMHSVGFQGSVRDFAHHLKNQKDLYPAHGKEILDSYRDMLLLMDKRLPDFFGNLPRAAYDIREIEHYRQQAAPSAYYYPPPRDFSRPGYFYVNIYKPEQRPKFVMEALAYHEAVPGHHLQIALMQEQKDMPDFRRYEGATAFIEGWALYAEKLAKEMGFYHDVYSEYGRFTFEIWRAVRLVVDTGIHFFQWSRDQSIQYCREHTGLEDHEIAVEIDRYIAMPGQALAYKMGELKILELRDEAREMLGSAFHISEFHDRLLENGALPLSVLKEVMKRWMKGKVSAL
jgi:uncharacterized protein (DUF885 family)